MRKLHPDLKNLLNVFRLASNDETHARRYMPEPEPQSEPESATAPQAPLLDEILRARALMSRIESSGVRLPVQLHDVLVQAWAAYEENCWTEQVDRSFCITLSLLESVARHRCGAAAVRPACTDATVLNNDKPGWTVIIGGRRKVLDGNE